MDFLNLLIPKEKIIGLEIGTQKMRMLYLKRDSFGNVRIQGKAEVNLDDDVIIFGVIKNKKKLSSALMKLKENFKPKSEFSPFAIVTIPQNSVYSDVLSFPKYLKNDQLIEAISFNAATSLPLPLAECYMDWQVIESGETKNKVLISTIPKKIADDYIDVLKGNGFKLIALEPAALSISRAADTSYSTALFLYLTEEGATSMIYSNKNCYFSQFESWQELSGGKGISNLADLNKSLQSKIKNLARYFEKHYDPIKIKKVLLMSEGFNADEIIRNIDSADLPIEKAKSNIFEINNYDWIPAAGAAARGFIPRSDDTIISLLPVGTESLYDNQKALSFSKSIFAVIFSLGCFYIAAFISYFSFISYLGSSIDKQMASRNNITFPAEDLKIEQETKEFNAYVGDLALVYPKVKADYGASLDKITGSNSFGVSMNNINMTDLAGPITISGVAVSRESLNSLRLQFENSPSFKNVKFSVQNIAQKNNIPFNISLYLQ